MKTREELDALKKEVAALEAKLAELNETELQEVCGGYGVNIYDVAVKMKEKFTAETKD